MNTLIDEFNEIGEQSDEQKVVQIMPGIKRIEHQT